MKPTFSSSRSNLFESGRENVLRSPYAAHFIEDMSAAGYDVLYDGNRRCHDYDGPFVQEKRSSRRQVRDATDLTIRCERLGNDELICFPTGWGKHAEGITCKFCQHLNSYWRTIACEECGRCFEEPPPFHFNEKRNEFEMSDAEFYRAVFWLAAFVIGAVVLQSLWDWIFG